MPWTVGGTTLDLEARHGRPVLINGEGAATAYDDDAAGLQQRLERERFQLIAVSRLNHETVGELVGFDGTRLLVGPDELQHMPPPNRNFAVLTSSMPSCRPSSRRLPG